MAIEKRIVGGVEVDFNTELGGAVLYDKSKPAPLAEEPPVAAAVPVPVPSTVATVYPGAFKPAEPEVKTTDAAPEPTQP